MTATPRRARPFSRLARPAVDEDALVRRYQRDAWTVVQCARRFGIGERHARDILDRHGIARRPHAASAVAPGVVADTYRKHQSVEYVATALGTSREAVRAALDQAGEPHSRHVPLPGFATGQHPVLARSRAARPCRPHPSACSPKARAPAYSARPPDWCGPPAAPGSSNRPGPPGGQRRYPRRQVTAFGQRLTAEARDD